MDRNTSRIRLLNYLSALIFIICLSHVVCAAEVIDGHLITQVRYDQLLNLIGFPGQMSVSDRGVVITLPERNGIEKDFILGVYENVQPANEAWNNLKASDKQSEDISQTVGTQSIIKSNHDDTVYQISIKQLNVLVQFNWQGTREDATNFAISINKALMTNAQLAPKGFDVVMPNIDLITPAYVMQDETFTVRYRTKPRTLVTMAPSGSDRSLLNNQITSFQNQNQPQTISSGLGSIRLSSLGTHELKFTFVTTGCVIINAVASVEVVDKDNYNKIKSASVWNLPEDSLYFTKNKGANWNDLDNSRKECIKLNKKYFIKFKPQPDHDEDFEKQDSGMR